MSKLNAAVWEMDSARVKAALAHEDVNALTHGQGALHTAVEKDWAEGIALLVAAGANVNLMNERGDTPLMTAVIQKNPAAAEALIAADADLEIPNKIGSTPLNYVVRMNAGLEMTLTTWEVVDGVKTNVTVHDPNEPRGRAIEVARLLIAAGANVDAEDGGQLTALSRALMQGDPELAELMLEAGADVNYRNETGYAPIIGAASKDRIESVEWLIEHGADLSAQDDSGFSALHEAAISGGVEVTEALLAAGADRTLSVKEGWEDIKPGMTPRDVAAVKGHAELLALYDA